MRSSWLPGRLARRTIGLGSAAASSTASRVERSLADFRKDVKKHEDKQEWLNKRAGNKNTNVFL